MEDDQRAVHRTVIAVDVQGFGNRRRTNANQLAIRAGLYRAMQEAFDEAGVPWESLYHEDRGDCIFILADPQVPKGRFVELLPSAVVNALDRHNSTHPRLERIRLRMALHAGEVNFDEHGVTGAAILLTFRLLDCAPVKAALARSSGVLAIITSSWFFREVVRNSTADTASYYQAHVRVKETVTTGWIHVPGGSGSGGHEPDQRSWPLPWRRTAVAAGLLLAALLLSGFLVRTFVTRIHLTQPGPAHPSIAVTGPPAGLIATLTDPQSTEVYAASFSPSGKVLATADLGHVYLRSTATWNISATLSVPSSTQKNVSSVAFGGGGAWLAAGDFDGNTYVFSATSRKLIHILPDLDPGDSGVEAVAFSPDGLILATADSDGSTYLWSTATWTIIAVLPDPHPGAYGVESVAFSPSGSMAATGDSNGSAYLWDVATRRPIATLTPDDHAGIDAVAFSPSGGVLATGEGLSQDFPFSGIYLTATRTYLWSTATGKLTGTLTDPITDPRALGVDSVAFSPDGTLLAAGDDNGITYLHSTSMGKIVATLPDAGGGISAVAFGPSGSVLATGDGLGASGTQASTYVWNVAKARSPG